MAGRFLRFLAFAAIVAVAFLAWMHPQILDITNVGWTLGGNDWGPNALGMAAYLRSGDWPGTATPLILAPQGTHLLMTDSNPLLGLLLKPFAPLLPPGVQFIGWWLLLCLALHVRFAWLLVRDQAPNFAGAWFGTALLTALPTLYNRYPHANLCSHWLILWALWIFVSRERSRRWGPWFAVIGLAGLIHSYLLVIVGAIWASAMLRELVTGDRPGRYRTLGQVGLISVMVACIALLHGLADPPLPTGSYGSFSMALDAPMNPTHSGFSRFLPFTPGKDGPDFEGFQYLGAGLILLVVIAAALSARRWWVSARPAAGSSGEPKGGLIWLLAALAILTLLAVSNHVLFRGAQILLVPLPAWLIDALDLVRSSGRLFWPVAYALVYAAVLAVYRLKRGTLVLAAALALQIADMSPMLATLRDRTTRAAEPGIFARTRDPRWQQVIARASAIEMEPPDSDDDHQLIEEIGWRAMLACRPMRDMYVARVSRTVLARMDADAGAFEAGKIDPTRLYILYAGETAPDGLEARVRVLDGIAIIPPSAPAPRPALCG